MIHIHSKTAMTRARCDRKEYVRLCASFKKTKPQTNVEVALSKSSSNGCLNLGGNSLSDETCEVLGKLLASSTNLKKVDFSNCMLPSLGASHILSGLSKNISINVIDMSSNNLQSSTAMKIGNMLRHNSTLNRLYLQWNSLGTAKDSFGLMCDGLVNNHSLEELDLRNNQLTHTAVTDLANVIRCNKTLKILDLRWNSMGSGEGRALLEVMQINKCITCIQLEGNGFSSDLVVAIEQCGTHNGEVIQLAEEWQSRCSVLVKHSAQLEHRDDQRTSGMRLVMQHQGHKLGELTRENQAQLSHLEGKLGTTKKRAETLQSMLKDKDEQLETLQEMHQLHKQDTEKDLLSYQSKLQVTLNDLELSRKLVQQQQCIIEGQRSEINSLQLQVAEVKDTLLLHNTKCSDVVKAAEERALSALHKVRQERASADEKVQRDRELMEQKLQQLDKQRVELEAKFSAERRNHQEALTAAREQAAQREAEKIAMLHATITLLTSEKNALYSQLEAQQDVASALRQEKIAAKEELAKHFASMSKLQQEILNEKEISIGLQRQVEEATSKCRDTSKLEAHLTQVQAQLTELHKEREAQVHKLTELVATQEQHIMSLRVNEEERAGLLCSAVTQYLTRAHPTAPPSSSKLL